MNRVQITRMLDPGTSAASLPLRLSAGIIFTAHGAQKLFGWFGGYGLDGTGQFMASLGLEPGYVMALLAGSAEFFGGIALLLGLAVRPAGLMLAVTMLVAIVTAHLPNGLFLSNNGYEFGLALLGISMALAVQGAGVISADQLLVRRLSASFLKSTRHEDREVSHGIAS
jgi:putative oxidoreductase